jgi:hypothetical protein
MVLADGPTITQLAVGGPGPVLEPSWDFWLPAYVLLSFLLIVAFVVRRIALWTGVASLVAGTVWAWVDNALGVIPAAALAVLVAVLAGACVRRIATTRPSP